MGITLTMINNISVVYQFHIDVNPRKRFHINIESNQNVQRLCCMFLNQRIVTYRYLIVGIERIVFVRL